MKITKFSDWLKKDIQEMAVDTGVNSRDNFSKDSEWDFYKNNENTMLVANNIGSQHYKVYQNGSNFFLTSKEDEYKGQLEGTIKDSLFVITSSNADSTVKGFYNIIFTVILGNTNITEINSDVAISSNAIRSYERLSVNSNLILKVKHRRETNKDNYLEFSKEELLKPNMVVSVSSYNLKEHFKDYYNRIQSIDKNGFPLAFNLEFNKQKGGVDRFLFCEDFSI